MEKVVAIQLIKEASRCYFVYVGEGGGTIGYNGISIAELELIGEWIEMKVSELKQKSALMEANEIINGTHK